MLKTLIGVCFLIGLSSAAPASGSGSEEDDQNVGKNIDDTTQQVGRLINALYSSTPQNSTDKETAKKLATLVYVLDGVDDAIIHAFPSFSGKLRGSNEKRLDKIYRLLQRVAQTIDDNAEEEEVARKIAKEAAAKIEEEYAKKRKQEQERRKKQEEEDAKRREQKEKDDIITAGVGFGR